MWPYGRRDWRGLCHDRGLHGHVRGLNGHGWRVRLDVLERGAGGRWVVPGRCALLGRTTNALVVVLVLHGHSDEVCP